MTDTPTSLDALGIKPVAWRYTQDGAPWPIVKDYRYVALEGSGWTETPLYSATDLAPLIAKARRVEALEAALREIADLEGEINPWNYDHDDACELNLQFCYGIAVARAALKENTDG